MALILIIFRLFSTLENHLKYICKLDHWPTTNSRAACQSSSFWWPLNAEIPGNEFHFIETLSDPKFVQNRLPQKILVDVGSGEDGCCGDMIRASEIVAHRLESSASDKISKFVKILHIFNCQFQLINGQEWYWPAYRSFNKTPFQDPFKNCFKAPVSSEWGPHNL